MTQPFDYFCAIDLSATCVEDSAVVDPLIGALKKSQGRYSPPQQSIFKTKDWPIRWLRVVRYTGGDILWKYACVYVHVCVLFGFCCWKHIKQEKAATSPQIFNSATQPLRN